MSWSDEDYTRICRIQEYAFRLEWVADQNYVMARRERLLGNRGRADEYARAGSKAFHEADRQFSAAINEMHRLREDY